MPATSAAIVREEIDFTSADTSGAADRLCGTLTYPGDGVPTGAAVLLLTPHPNFAGVRQNPLLAALATAFATAGRIVLGFDYHGIGGSTCRQLRASSIIDHWAAIEDGHEHGLALRDARAALTVLHDLAQGRDDPRILVCGYSYGAVVASLAFATDDRVCAEVWLAPPYRRHEFAIGPCSRRRLLYSGSDDFLFDPAAVERLRQHPGVTGETCAGADHFFRGHESAVARRVTAFLDSLDRPDP